MRRRDRALLVLALAACTADGGESSASAGATEATSAAATTPSTSAASETAATTASTSASTSAATTTTTATTTSTTTSTTTTSTSTTGPLDHCPSVATPAVSATIADPEISEASGLCASRSQPGVFWTHNDSGDGARFFALDGAGATLGTFTIKGESAVDWEDMSLGPGPTPGEWLYFGDIGDNLEARIEISVLRIHAPDAAAAGGGEVELGGAETIHLNYPDTPHNAETLIVDPATGDLFIVIKADPTRIFRLPGPLGAGGPFILEEVTPIDFPPVIATGGDVSATGDFVAVRTYVEARLWLRPPGGTLADAFASAPCVIPLAGEVQGESLAIAADGAGYYTLSEKAAQPLWWYAFE